jgi:hypothetical protein
MTHPPNRCRERPAGGAASCLSRVLRARARSTAINVLEDLGFEAIDNLPLSLIPRLLDGPPLGARWRWASTCATATSARAR